MRIPILLLLLASAACGQTNVSKLLQQGLKDAAVSLAPVPDAEKKEVLTATAMLLAKHVNFRADGIATSTYNGTSAWPVEWGKLVVSSITSRPLNDADRLNGITRRYYASISCDACRDWKPKATAWSEWRQSGFILFSSVVVVEEKNGVVTARGNNELPKFTPGPGPSVVEKQSPGKKDDLPPGVTRIK